MDILIDLKFVFFNLFLLIIWFKTEAFIEYFKYIPVLRNLCKIEEYYKFRLSQDVIYPDFLVIKYNNFFTRLISCYKCINFWITAGSLYFYAYKMNFFFVYFTVIILYSIFNKLDKYE